MAGRRFEDVGAIEEQEMQAQLDSLDNATCCSELALVQRADWSSCLPGLVGCV